MMRHLTVLLLCAVSALIVGCSNKTDAGEELQRAADSFAASSAAPPPAQAPAPAPVPQPTQAATQTPPPAPAREMKQAMASYKAGNLEDAVTRLQNLRAQTAMTAEQRMALQDAVAAVMTEIYTLASKGDARAIAAVKQYEAMQTNRR